MERFDSTPNATCSQQTPINWESLEDQYAKRIRTAWSKTVEGILDVGQALIEAKSELKHGHFEHLVKERCPFGASAARQLMAVARHEVISNREFINVLPASWGTLYELSKFAPRELKHAIRSHFLKPDIPRKEVPDLLRRVRRALRIRTRRPPLPATKPATFAQCLRRILGPETVARLSSLDESTTNELLDRVKSEIEAFLAQATRKATSAQAQTVGDRRGTKRHLRAVQR